MIKKLLFASLAMVGLFALTLVVGAQAPGPGARPNFARGGRGGMGGRGGGWASAKCAPSCAQYQFTWTRTTEHPVVSSSSPSGATIATVVTTGTIAGDQYGSTYHDGPFSAMGPWASQPGPQQIVFVRDLDPGVMMNYIEHINTTTGVTTLEQFPIKPPPTRPNANPNPNWTPGGPGKGPGKRPAGSGKGPTVTPLTGFVLDPTYTCPNAVQTTFSHGAVTMTRIVCTSLNNLLLQESSAGGASGSSSYTLSNYTALTKFPFMPTGTPKAQHRRGMPGGHKPGVSSTPAV